MDDMDGGDKQDDDIRIPGVLTVGSALCAKPTAQDAVMNGIWSGKWHCFRPSGSEFSAGNFQLQPISGMGKDGSGWLVAKVPDRSGDRFAVGRSQF